MIIITRPSPYGETLTKICQTAGFAAKHLPFFKISAGPDLPILQHKLNALNDNDIVIATSPQVIEQINQYSTLIQFPTTIQYFAVGQQTATLFSQLTKKKVISPSFNESSEGLLNYLVERNISVTNRNVLILCAKNGKTLLKDVLLSRRANVENIYIYHKDRILHSNTILDDNADKLSNINIIAITSQAHLLELEHYCQNKHKSQFTLIVTRKQIKQLAETLGWKRVYLAINANNYNLFRTISTLCSNETIVNTLDENLSW